MNDAVPQFTTTYDLKNIVVVVIATLAGVLLYIYARKGEPRLWRQPLKVAVAIVFWIAVATFLYVLVGSFGATGVLLLLAAYWGLFAFRW